jgi:hypothetical protein
MRWLALTLAAVLMLPAAAGAQVAWAKAYEDGIKLFEAQNYALAEQKLREARDHDRAPEQSRRANFSSVVFKPFVPDLYLGVIAARAGRYAEAKQTLERVLTSKMITEGERKEYALATGALQQAQLALAKPADKPIDRPVETRTAENKPPAPPPPTNPTTTPVNPITPTPSNNTGTAVTPPPVRPPVQPPANAEPAWLAEFRRLMDNANALLRQSRYTEARSSVTAAARVAGDAARQRDAESLRRNIESAQNIEAGRIAERANAAIRLKDIEGASTQVARLETLAPDHASLPGLRSGIDGLRGALQGLAALATAERLGVKLFLSGNYKQSGDQLERAVSSGVTSPRIYLFLASSRAAQALLAPQAERASLEAQARQHYARAKSGGNALANDQRFISPRILQLLSGS